MNCGMWLDVSIVLRSKEGEVKRGTYRQCHVPVVGDFLDLPQGMQKKILVTRVEERRWSEKRPDKTQSVTLWVREVSNG